ncbi:carboxylate-amine ligase [Leucobacter japonicus]|uniref:carboxylate-amine ligase n=1 Tax=Leucobacter japonicus TaxID=1461259 RepID=UPI0006A7DC62|nr:YbdK family carboxylate-amine ligase [Leucobacter japonicus]
MAATPAAPPRFGVEEEYLLLDAQTGAPRDAVDEMIAALPGRLAEHEYFHCQLETATPVCDSNAQALNALSEFRVAAADAADNVGVVLAGSGLPPLGGERHGTRVGKQRYHDIESAMRGMVTRYYSTGTHVHVEVPSRDAGVGAIARIAPWSPILVALTANSPIWLGEETGYADWRFMSIQQWPTSGYPPKFDDAAEYDRVVSGLVRSGALLDGGLVNWLVRLSDKYPTIEARLADSQLTAGDAVAYGLLFRALVARALREYELGAVVEEPQRDHLRGAHWVAARNGLESVLVDPASGDPRPAFDVVDALLDHVAPELERAGDLALVTAFVERRKQGGGARAQLEHWRSGGISALLGLYRGAHREP